MYSLVRYKLITGVDILFCNFDIMPINFIDFKNLLFMDKNN